MYNIIKIKENLYTEWLLVVKHLKPDFCLVLILYGKQYLRKATKFQHLSVNN